MNRLYTVSHIVTLNSNIPKLDEICHSNNKMREKFQIFYYNENHLNKIASFLLFLCYFCYNSKKMLLHYIKSTRNFPSCNAYFSLCCLSAKYALFKRLGVETGDIMFISHNPTYFFKIFDKN